MSVNILDLAIGEHPFPPKGLKVGSELWKHLVVSNRIKWKRGYILGISDSGFDFPVINETIFVHVDPDLDDFSFEMPREP